MTGTKLNSLTIPAGWVANELITDTKLNSLTKTSGGLETMVSLLANKDPIESGSAVINCTQNVTSAVVGTGTTQTVNLPAWAGQSFPILVVKARNNYNLLRIQRNGATTDTINNPFQSSSIPVETNFDLYLPGESCLLIPRKTNNVWDVVMVNEPLAALGALVNSSTTQSNVASGTTIALNTASNNRSGSWSTSSYRYTARAPLDVAFQLNTHCKLSTNGGMDVIARRYNSSNTLLESIRCSSIVELSANPFTLIASVKFRLDIGNYVNFAVRTAGGTVSIFGNSLTSDALTTLGVTPIARYI